jgi:hypothetical protein
LTSILLGGVSARLRHYRPQCRELLLVLELLLMRARLKRSCSLGHLEGMRMRLLILARLLLVENLLLNMLVLEGALGSIVGAR